MDTCVYGNEISTKELKMSVNQKRVLRRSRSNRIFAGVCGGLAEFFGISSFWFRLALIIAFIPGGVPGLLLYFILWMIIPKE
jgi:phage shock protein C